MLTRRARKYTVKINRSFEKREQIGRERLNKPFALFVALMPYMTTESVQGLVIIPPPKQFHKRDVPQDLSLATFGTLTRLQGVAKSEGDYLRLCCALVETLTGVPRERVASSPALQVLGVVNMIKSEMERIGKLFQGLQSDRSSDEINAGIERLDFGPFGIVDWYAQRMGIVDHEEVFNTPWARIYQCMKIDHENNEFEKRYRKIINNKNKGGKR